MLGLFGSATTVTTQDGWQSTIRLVIGLPPWLLAKCLYFNLQFASLNGSQGGLQFLPSSIRVQNRVPDDFPFLKACREGDTALIKQHLRDRTGDVGDRAMSTGETPLLVGFWLFLYFFKQ